MKQTMQCMVLTSDKIDVCQVLSCTILHVEQYSWKIFDREMSKNSKSRIKPHL